MIDRLIANGKILSLNYHEPVEFIERTLPHQYLIQRFTFLFLGDISKNKADK